MGWEHTHANMPLHSLLLVCAGTARAACPLQAGCGGHRFQWFPLAARSLPLLLQCAHTGTSAGKGELDLGSCGKGRVFKEQEGQNGH